MSDQVRRAVLHTSGKHCPVFTECNFFTGVQLTCNGDTADLIVTHVKPSVMTQLLVSNEARITDRFQSHVRVTEATTTNGHVLHCTRLQIHLVDDADLRPLDVIVDVRNQRVLVKNHVELTRWNTHHVGNRNTTTQHLIDINGESQ
ncbi:hypothetical protein D3C86_1357490 [compost metagenome]